MVPKTPPAMLPTGSPLSGEAEESEGGVTWRLELRDSALGVSIMLSAHRAGTCRTDVIVGCDERRSHYRRDPKIKERSTPVTFS